MDDEKYTLKMDDEKLILLVQANECLYNKTSSGFKLVDKKKQIWSNIAQQMKLPDEVCIKRWSCLSDRFSKENRLESLPSGSGSKFKTHWPLMQTMEFILPYIVPRVTRCSSNILEKVYTSPSESSSPLPHLVEDLCSSPINSMKATPSPNIQKCSARKRKNADISELDNSFMEAVESFKKVCDFKIHQKTEEDYPLTAFGKMVVALIATMTTKRQLETMQYVTAYVMDIKLKSDEASETESINL